MDSETLYFNQLFDITGNLYYSAAYDEEMRLRSEWVDFLTEQYNLILEYLQAWANEYDDAGALDWRIKRDIRDIIFEWLYKSPDGYPERDTHMLVWFDGVISAPSGYPEADTPFGFRYIQEVASDSNQNFEEAAYIRDSANGIGQVLSDMKNLAGLDICEFSKILLGDYWQSRNLGDKDNKGSFGDWDTNSGDDVYGNTRADRFETMEGYFDEAGAPTGLCYAHIDE
jgi:hypothetical protein